MSPLPSLTVLQAAMARVRAENEISNLLMTDYLERIYVVSGRSVPVRRPSVTLKMVP